jgi:hypothetical protein
MPRAIANRPPRSDRRLSSPAIPKQTPRPECRPYTLPSRREQRRWPLPTNLRPSNSHRRVCPPGRAIPNDRSRQSGRGCRLHTKATWRHECRCALKPGSGSDAVHVAPESSLSKISTGKPGAQLYFYAPAPAEPLHEHPSRAQAEDQQDKPEEVALDRVDQRLRIVDQARLPSDGSRPEDRQDRAP